MAKQAQVIEAKLEVKEIEKVPELSGNALIIEKVKDLVATLKQVAKENQAAGKPARRQLALAHKLNAVLTRKVFA